MDFRHHVRAHLPELRLRREPEIVDEIAEHLAEIYDEARREGCASAVAEQRALAALPSCAEPFARDLQKASEPLLPVKRRFSIWTDTRADIRDGVRGLLHAPGFTLAVVLTLALGIGANTVIFGAIDAVLLRPATIASPERVVHVYSASADGRGQFLPTSYPNYVDIAALVDVFDGVVAYASIQLALDLRGTTERVSGQIVSGNYFSVLGVPLAEGRGFTATEDRADALSRVVVVSDDAWRRYFAADPLLVGRSVTLNGQPYAVVGIAPRGFRGPVLGQAVEFWVPMSLQPELRPPSAALRRSLGTSRMLEARSPGWINILARLAPGATADPAAAALDVVARRLETAFPDTNRGRRFTLAPLGEGPGVRTSARPLLRALAAAVALVLLIACANVASLLIVRSLSRQKDIAVRLALGASRTRLARQWLTDALLLAVLGGVGAVLAAWWTTPLLYTLGIPESVDLTLDARVTLFAFVTAIASGLLSGSMSLAQVMRRDAMTALRDESRGSTSSSRATRLRSGFVIAQVALTIVLLVGAGLFLRTLQNAYSVELGYDIGKTVLTEVNLDLRGYAPEAGQRVYEQILDVIRAIPGVAAVAAARVVVLSGSARVTSVSLDGQPIAADQRNAFDARVNVVSHDYLATLGITLLRGRGFAATDSAVTPHVAVISRSLAARRWPDSEPIGQSLVTGGTTYEVIGIAPDTIYGRPTESEPLPFFYSLLAQGYESAVTLHIRAVTDPMDMMPAVRRVVRAVDPLLTLTTPVRLSDVLQRSLGDQRLMARLVTAFGFLALGLAVIGLYGVLTHVVTSRRTEIGVRVALGADPRLIVRMVLLQGVRLVVIGAAIGLIAALAATRYIESQLFGVTSSDPLTLLAAVMTLFAVALVACAVPASRALRVDAADVLR
jgi:predicted permease